MTHRFLGMQPEKKLLLAVSEDQWLGLKRIGLDQRKTLKAVCLDAIRLMLTLLSTLRER